MPPFSTRCSIMDTLVAPVCLSVCLVLRNLQICPPFPFEIRCLYSIAHPYPHRPLVHPAYAGPAGATATRVTAGLPARTDGGICGVSSHGIASLFLPLCSGVCIRQRTTENVVPRSVSPFCVLPNATAAVAVSMPHQLLLSFCVSLFWSDEPIDLSRTPSNCT